MIEQAPDFKAECEALYALLSPLDEAQFELETQFKGWTINQILAHLHLWNIAADKSLADEAAFVSFTRELGAWVAAKKGTMREFELKQVNDLKGHRLLSAWHTYYAAMAARFYEADSKKRVKWVGPDMSVRSSITARLMETWAHGQAVYDILGIARENKDHIKNIAVLGVNTYGWTFQVRGLKPLEPKPYVELLGPTGATWQWGEASDEVFIKGLAEEFCQVVTQTRNIADTRLEVKGEAAQFWMSNAQCFAGGAEKPPAAKTRFTTR